MYHPINVKLATKFNVDISIFLSYLYFKTINNLKEKDYKHNGLSWVRNPLHHLNLIFPYWSKIKLQGIIHDCINQDLIVKCFDNEQRDERGSWYALSMDTMIEFFSDICRVESKESSKLGLSWGVK